MFVKLFQPSLMLVGKARSLSYSCGPERYFTQISTLPTNIRLGRKGSKSFKTLGPGPNVIKLFTAVIYTFL
jgi:hypothetical protein